MSAFGYDGLSVALGNGLVGIDLDHCFDYQLSPFAQSVVNRIPSYTEFSLSGTGIHLFLQAHIPSSRRNKEIEIYGSGRFLSLTGIHFVGSPYDVADCQTAGNALYEELFPKEERRPVLPGRTLTDNQVLTNARRHVRFVELYESGDLTAYHGDWSSADIAVIRYLQLAGASPEQADRLHRDGALMRAKWLRFDYRNATLTRVFGVAYRCGTPEAMGLLVRDEAGK
jgi:putative DNA primase/helicase